MRVGIYPGTFDPITFGHMDIIRRALKVVDKLVIGVALDSSKTPLFDVQKRAELVRGEIASLGADAKRIEVKTFSGLLATFAQEEKAALIIRGLRGTSDFEYEFQMSNVNHQIAPDLETAFFAASDTTNFIAARFVKEIARLGGDVSKFVSPRIAKALTQQFEKARPVAKTGG